MTIGDRILQKRKELGLSQEALGEQLGVSRQAIYKWESGATLPEIDKLVALSRIFSVSVGWLLGVEEDCAPAEENGELSEEQLRMVQEITERYLAAQPKPKALKKWPFVLAAAVLVIVFVNLFNRMSQLNSTLQTLQMNTGNISYNVNQQINGIANRVEEILKAQNNLTAEYSTAIDHYNFNDNTVTFTLRAVPKTYFPGMSATFLVKSGNETVKAEGSLGEGNAYTAEIACPLTDDISLSVVFATDSKEETQLLNQYGWLASEVRPSLWLNSSLFGFISVGKNGQLLNDQTHLFIDPQNFNKANFIDEQPRIVSVRVGLFKDFKLVQWYEPDGSDFWADHTQVTDMTDLNYKLKEPVTLEEGGNYCVAAFATDQYGQEYIATDGPYLYSSDTENGPFMEAIDKIGNYQDAPWQFES